MNIIIVDGFISHHTTFRTMLSDRHKLVCNYTNKIAIKSILENEAFDLALIEHNKMPSLDRDGLEIRCDGYALAKEIIATVPRGRWPKRVITHSWNVEGAKDIMNAFNEAGIDASWNQSSMRMVATLAGELSN